MPNNQSSAESLLALDDDFKPVSVDVNDGLKQAICSSKSQFKRSVKSLRESGMMPKHSNAITSCPLNVDQICLNLRDDEAPSELFSIASSGEPFLIGSLAARKLEIQLPFTHNKIIDSRSSSVKISNIFFDTSDGRHLLAQFEVTSMDHYTKRFNLSFSRCALLQQLNISQSILIPPNRSMIIKVNVALPFYAEHRDETCEGKSRTRI